jgi:putative ABC transport system substrate-binding protein
MALPARTLKMLAALRGGCMLLVAQALLAPPAAAQAAKHHVGFLSPASASSMAPRLAAFRAGLRDLGHREGESIVIEYRWADGKDGRLAGLASELVSLKVDMLLVHGVTAVQAARKTGTKLPIVCFACGDLLSTGVVPSLARPGGNVTGLTILAPDVSGKRLELLREIKPGWTRIAVLWNALNPVSVPELRETETAARALGMQVQSFAVKTPEELPVAVEAMRVGRAEAMILLSDAMLYGQRRRIAELALAARLPTVSWTGEFAKEGGLIGYGPDVFAIARRAATYVDKILKGARPADLPIEQPDKFDFVLNLRTAQALRLDIPRSVMLRASDVIR